MTCRFTPDCLCMHMFYIPHYFSCASSFVHRSYNKTKTTIMGDVTKIISHKNNVFVVDTSNKIAGDQDIPHQCVRDA